MVIKAKLVRGPAQPVKMLGAAQVAEALEAERMSDIKPQTGSVLEPAIDAWEFVVRVAKLTPSTEEARWDVELDRQALDQLIREARSIYSRHAR